MIRNHLIIILLRRLPRIANVTLGKHTGAML